jgi:hypothetical protein
MQRVATRPLTSAVAAVKAPAPETTGLDDWSGRSSCAARFCIAMAEQ